MKESLAVNLSLYQLLSNDGSGNAKQATFCPIPAHTAHGEEEWKFLVFLSLLSISPQRTQAFLLAIVTNGGVTPHHATWSWPTRYIYQAPTMCQTWKEQWRTAKPSSKSIQSNFCQQWTLLTFPRTPERPRQVDKLGVPYSSSIAHHHHPPTLRVRITITPKQRYY